MAEQTRVEKLQRIKGKISASKTTAESASSKATALSNAVDDILSVESQLGELESALSALDTSLT